MQMASVMDAVKALRDGGYVLLLDSPDREDEGDLLVAAEFVLPEHLTFMAENCRTLICVAMEGERLDELEIPLMVPFNTSTFGTPFTVSVDLKSRRTSGSSAVDRAATIRALIDPATRPSDLAMPGHVFPLRAVPGGVLQRRGHTEGAVDLLRLGGLYPAGVISEIQGSNGEMLHGRELGDFAARLSIPLLTIDDIARHRPNPAGAAPGGLRAIPGRGRNG